MFPVKRDQKYVLMHPGRKPGDLYENYCPKAKVEVEISSPDLQTEFTCFPDPDDCHSSACVGNFLSLLTEDISEVQVTLRTEEQEVNTASIWELNISEVPRVF